MFNKLNFIILLLLSGIFTFTSCAKIPEKVISPAVDIKIKSTVNTEEKYLVNFTCGLKNENDSTVFIDVKGIIDIIDKEDKVLSIPFEIPVILPFETGIVQTYLEKTSSEINPLISMLNLKKSDLNNNTASGFIEEKNIKLTNLNLHKISIVKFLKGKIDEKNK